jgi:hypothetical protein
MYSPFLFEEYSRDRMRSLSRHLEACRLAEKYGERSPPRWRRLLARALVSLSLHLDRGAAKAALEAQPSPRQATAHVCVE